MGGIDSTAAAIEASHAERDRLRAEVERLGVEVKRLQGLVLRPLTEADVTAALHEGHAERRAAEGDNAWASLLADRDKLRAEVARLGKQVAQYAQALQDVHDYFARAGRYDVAEEIARILRQRMS